MGEAREVCMIRKFDKEAYRWEGVEPHVYKKDSAVFRDVTKQVLFENEGDLPVQFRYFQVEPGGWSSLEHHEHMHMVVIFRGKGHALVGEEVFPVGEGDLVTIPSEAWHQFRADRGVPLGFFCLVNARRDAPEYPSAEELAELRKRPEVAAFLDGRA